MSETRKAFYSDFEQLLLNLSVINQSYDIELIKKAYNIANKAHENQRRLSGVPYILHPTSVACIVAEHGMDTQTIVAALLHDVVEDTSVTLDDLKEEFSEEISNIVDGVTKLGSVPFISREDEQAENARKMIIAMSKDIRVIIVKLADRLHNMRTIECMKPQKRRDKAFENMELYAPIADRLGIRTIKEELEDLSLKYLDPVAYKEIQDSLKLKEVQRICFLESIKEKLKDKISAFLPNVHIEGRVKSTNGIYKKMFIKNKLIEEIYDVYAVRVIVDTINDCYNVLGIVHDIFNPIPNRFKDYISMPKMNMYQSLHTTVVGNEEVPFEVQIRTWDMHKIAEYGVAAHWKYKLGLKEDSSIEDRTFWIKQMLENQIDKEDAIDLLRTIKTDLVPESIYVLTPKGDVKCLPLGSTVVDFAYSIHTDIGNKMIGAKVDKRIVPFDYKLETGQIIEIISTKDANKGPNRDWLNIVKTSEARNKIKQWFKRERREENKVEGRQLLEKEISKIGLNLEDEFVKKTLSKMARRHRCEDLNQFFELIGYGGINLSGISYRIRIEYNKKKTEKKVSSIDFHKREKSSSKSKDSVIVNGVDNCSVKFSKCCNPVPGDEIIGFITRGKGVSIHKKNCRNVPKEQLNERWIKASWENCNIKDYVSNIKVIASNAINLLSDVTTTLYKLNISINSFNSSVVGDKSIIYIGVTVKNLSHLSKIIDKLSTLDGVISVLRV